MRETSPSVMRGNAMAEAKKPAKTAARKDDGFSAEERAAMKARAKEMKAAKAGADAEKLTLAAIAPTANWPSASTPSSSRMRPT
jgi:hypothetical protein